MWGSEVMASATPLPLKKLTIVSLIFFVNNASIWMIFSFLPFMVFYYYPHIDPSEVGYFSGILGSAFSLGSMFGSFFWGLLADRFGRRVVLLSSLLGTAFSAALFGLSPNYWSALLARFLWGLLNGNVGVGKSYLAEIHDDSNFAKGLAIFEVIGGLGRAIGPAIGGFLAQPASHYANFRGTVFETFPFALPSLIIVVFCLLVFCVAYFELSETLLIYSPLHGSEEEESELQNHEDILEESSNSSEHSLSSSVDKSSGLEMGQIPFLRNLKYLSPTDYMHLPSTDSDHFSSPSAQIDEEDVTAIKSGCSSERRLTFNGIVEIKNFETGKCEYATLKTSDHQELVNDIEYGLDSKEFQNPSVKYSNGSELIRENSDVTSWKQFRYFFRTKIIFLSIILYGLLSLIHVITIEVFPLWLILPRDEGGFGFSSAKAGLLLTFAGSISIISQVSIYPTLIDKYGPLYVFRVGTIVYFFSTLLLPLSDNFLRNPNVLSVVLIAMSNTLLTSSAEWCFICVSVFINNSCYNHQRGKVNGLGQFCASVGRSVGPICGTSLFAWTAHHSQWPLNSVFVWYIVAIGAFTLWKLSSKLPKKIIKRRREPRVPRYALSMMKTDAED